MNVWIEDTVRNNLVTWTGRAVDSGRSTAAVISPFSSPVAGNGYKQATATVVARLRDAGADVWFDPTTHALQMAGVGDFRYYDTWDLWGNARGHLETEGDRRDHVERVFSIQDQFGARHLAPAILLHTGQSQTSERALSMSQIAMGIDPSSWLTIAGDVHFWASADLDAHVGALAQLQPAGWFLVVVRAQSVLPVVASAKEVHGLLRTTRSLSEYAPVHISRGDIAALPAIVAGATSVGTGWDVRQRVCAYSDYAPRSSDGEGGQWYQRPTLAGLFGNLKPTEYEVLRAGSPATAQRLLPGNLPPGPEAAFLHHCGVLSDATDRLTSLSEADAYRELVQAYDQASLDWPSVVSATGCVAAAPEWVKPLRDGLAAYGADEGL